MISNHSKLNRSAGFSLVEVVLAIGIVSVAILSLAGLIGSSFQQVDEIMQTNRALTSLARLTAALESPRTIIVHPAGEPTGVIIPANDTYLHQASTSFTPPLDPNPAASPASNFDIVYRLLSRAKNNSTNAVWLYVYERKIISVTREFAGTATGDQYPEHANPVVMEVASAIRNNNNFTVAGANARNVIGTPMRVRLSLSKLLHGQQYKIDPVTFEPTSERYIAGTSELPLDPNNYPLAYLPIVAEFFPHDFTDSSVFGTASTDPIIIQNIVISR